MSEEPLKLLRAPFPEHQISKLPKPTKAQTDEVRNDFKKGIRCDICGAWHHPKVVHLDYVGHAALTDRLLDTDMAWSWEPLSVTEQGLPAFDSNNGLWIKLTVQGVTRLGYGSADGKAGGDAIKEIIGDALRNAAMRFGAALDLWHKGDLHIEDAAVPSEPPPEASAQGRQQPPKLTGPLKTRAEVRVACGEFVRELHACEDGDQLEVFLTASKPLIDQVKDEVEFFYLGDGADFIGLAKEIENARNRVYPGNPV